MKASGGQARLFPNPLLYLQGDQGGRSDVLLVARHIQIGFVQRQGFHQIGVVQKDGTYLRRYGTINLETGWLEMQLRAKALCLQRGHGGTDPEFPGFVAGGGNHRTCLRPAHSHRLAPQLGEIPLLYRGIERVHIYMYDFPHLLARITLDARPDLWRSYKFPVARRYPVS